jgi:hypothetical protein
MDERKDKLYLRVALPQVAGRCHLWTPLRSLSNYVLLPLRLLCCASGSFRHPPITPEAVPLSHYRSVAVHSVLLLPLVMAAFALSPPLHL